MAAYITVIFYQGPFHIYLARRVFILFEISQFLKMSLKAKQINLMIYKFEERIQCRHLLSGKIVAIITLCITFVIYSNFFISSRLNIVKNCRASYNHV